VWWGGGEGEGGGDTFWWVGGKWVREIGTIDSKKNILY
jgi:hypothetical protein